MKIALFIVILFFGSTSFSQVDKTSELYRTLKAKDSLIFNVGFNNIDIKPFEELLSDNFEFYHDEAGLTSSKNVFIQSIKDLSKLNYKPRRQLSENSLQVFPLKRNGTLYGAIQTGEHKFYATDVDKDKLEFLTSSATFTHVWLLENGQWRLSRVLSYNHHEPKNTDANESLLFKDRSETEKWLVKNHVPALGIGYIEKGKIQEVVVYGRNDDGSSRPNNTIFDVASLTKPITGMVALQLVNSGEWNLDEPIYHYWTDPDVADDPRLKELTTRHILSHQSGFPNWRDGKLVFEFTPGSKYQYSGEGFEYLRKALEKKFKKPLDQLASELIFKPLKMNDTRFYWDSTMDGSKFAKRYRGDGTAYETFKNSSANGANHLLTTIEDYSKFMVFVMNGADLKKDLYKQMISNQVRIKPRKYFGLGWWIDENVNEGENALVHGGDDKGVHTIAFILPQSKQGLLIFTNCDNGTDIYMPIVQQYLSKAGQGIIDVETK